MPTSRDIQAACDNARRGQWANGEFCAESAFNAILDVLDIMAGRLAADEAIEDGDESAESIANDDYESTFIRTRNSLYEVDTTNKRVRRIRGDNPPCPRFCDAEWVEFEAVATPVVGYRCCFRMHSGELIYTSEVEAVETPADLATDAARIARA